MTLKAKFFIEVIILTIFFSLIPVIWINFYFNLLKDEYVKSVDKLVFDLVEMPKQAITISDYVANENINPPIGIVHKFVFRTNFDEIIYKWTEDEKPVELVVDPNFGPIGNNPLELRVSIRGSSKAKMIDGQYYYDPGKFSLRIIKDPRAVSTVNLLSTQAKIETQTFTQQQDGLRDIQVANTDTKDNFGNIYWKFDQDKLPYHIHENARQIDVWGDNSFIYIFYPNSLPQLLYYIANSGSGYFLSIFKSVLLPMAMISLLSYFFSHIIFKKNNLLKLNIVFLVLTVTIYPLYSYISFFLLLLFYFSIMGRV